MSDMKSVIYTNRRQYVMALTIEIIILAMFGFSFLHFSLNIEILIVAILIGVIAIFITVSGLMNPTRYIFAYDNVKFGFKQNDDVVIEGYFTDVESVDWQSGTLAYQSEIETRHRNGEKIAPFVISSRNDLIIKMNGQKPVCLPSGFFKTYNEFIEKYKGSV